MENEAQRESMEFDVVIVGGVCRVYLPHVV